MTRSIRTFPAVSGFRGRRKGSPQERPFRLTDGSLALVRERLDTFAAAFLADPRPGLVFEYGRLVSANVAARSLLGSTSASDSFLEALKVSVGNGVMERGLLFRARSGVYAPVLHPARNLRSHPTRICFLIKQRELAPAFAALSARGLGVLTLLVKGLTNGQIADELGISIETVRKHVSRVREDRDEYSGRAYSGDREHPSGDRDRSEATLSGWISGSPPRPGGRGVLSSS